MRNFISFAYGDHIKQMPRSDGDDFYDPHASGEMYCKLNVGDRIIVVYTSGQVKELIYGSSDTYTIFGKDGEIVSLFEIKFVGRVE